VVDNIIEFLTLTDRAGVAWTEEQMNKFVYDFMLELVGGNSNHLLTPFRRIDAFYLLSKIEARSARAKHLPYFDAMQRAYDEYLEFVRSSVLHLASSQALATVMTTLQNANLRDDESMHKICDHFFMFNENNLDKLAQGIE
jgi:hypothetical protein